MDPVTTNVAQPKARLSKIVNQLFMYLNPRALFRLFLDLQL